ncbi:MAG: hypothetical protein ACOZF2_13055 [Thermodesulfobacteriota bacterium]
MELFKTIALIILSVIGIIAGILSLPEKYRIFRKERYPHGEKGTDFFILSKSYHDERQIVDLLVIGDIFHFLKNFLRPKEWEGKVESLEKIGEYFKVVISYSKDATLQYTKTK